jgi:serine/threonine protein kinase
MGVVLRARDGSLKRTLALKVLRRRFQGEPELAARFLEEAQVTGQLQHPGIPPVYEVGSLEDGQPFLAMKLIRGTTLHDLLRQRKDRRKTCRVSWGSSRACASRWPTPIRAA